MVAAAMVDFVLFLLDQEFVLPDQLRSRFAVIAAKMAATKSKTHCLEHSLNVGLPGRSTTGSSLKIASACCACSP